MLEHIQEQQRDLVRNVLLENMEERLGLRQRIARDYVQQDIRAPLDPLTNMEELLQLVLVLDLVPVAVYVLLERIQQREQPPVQHAPLDTIQQQGQHLVRNALLEVTVVRVVKIYAL